MLPGEQLRCRTPWRRYLLVLVIWVVTGVPNGFAQGVFTLGKREGFIEFAAESAGVTSSFSGTSDLRTAQRRFAERVGLRGDFSVMDPKFLTLTYGATFDFLQDSITNNQANATGTGRLFSYSFDGNFLSSKSYSLNFFANRTNSISLREFAGNTELHTRNEGVAFYLKSFFLPSTVSYRDELSDEDSRFASLLSQRNERRKVFAYDGRNHWKSHDLGIHYEWADVQDLVTPSLSYRTRTAGINHRYQFGEDLPRSLNFNINYVRRDGNQNLGSAALTLNEELNLQHTKSFSSAYHYSLSRYAGFGSDTTVHVGAISLQHRLYESLRTELILQAVHSGLTGGTQRVYGGRVNGDYHKKLPRKGTLLAGLSVRYEIENDRIGGRVLPVFQEKHVARIGLPFRLTQPRVITATVSISGETGAIFFSEGLDYLLRTVGEFTEVEVLVSGRIREGEVLVVDYEVNAPPAQKFSTFAEAVNIGPDFGWIYPYYIFERNRQRLLFGVDPGALENLRANTTGVRLRWTGNKTSALFINEYRSQQSRLLPYSSLQFSQVFSYTPQHLLNVSLNFDEGLSHYMSPDRRTTTGLGRLTVGTTPRPNLNADIFLSVRIWRDSIAVNENFQQAGFRVRWSVSKFSAVFNIDRDIRTRDRIQSHEFRWFASVIRRF